MTQSSNLRFFGFNKDRKSGSSGASQKLAAPTPADTAVPSPPSPHSQADVHGWLMTVPGYREEQSLASEPGNFRDDNTATQQGATDYEQNGIPTEIPRRTRINRAQSISSVSSSDSVNLDELIKNNFALQVDEETDLPNLADLDLDDSTDDFWKMGDSLMDFSSAPHTTISNDGSTIATSDQSTLKGPQYAPRSRLRTPSALSSRYSESSSDHGISRQRSGSLSSEASLTSQSTITINTNQYAHYGMTPMIYPSESTSNSSRSPSRLSDYSAGSSQTSSTTTGIPRPRTGSSALPTPNTSGRRSAADNETSRPSSRLASPGSRTQSRLATRATHVPRPSSRAAPAPVVTTTSRSTGLSGTRLPAASQSKQGSRAAYNRRSHIPAPPLPRNHAASPEPTKSPPLNPSHQAQSRPRSPISSAARASGVRSPGPRNSIFGAKPTSEIPRPGSAMSSGKRTTGLRPPGTISGIPAAPRNRRT